MVNAVRLMALQHGIAAPATLDRLNQLSDQQVLSPQEAAFYKTGFESLMMFRIRENLKQVRAGQRPDNTLDPKELNKNETLLLKDALSAVTQLQKRIGREFQLPWMNFFGQ